MCIRDRLTGQGITNINKSDVAGKIALNIPVKISTGRLISTVRPEYRLSLIHIFNKRRH